MHNNETPLVCFFTFFFGFCLPLFSLAAKDGSTSVPVVSVYRSSGDLDNERSRHWAWAELKDPAPPKVQDGKWVRNGVDYFILSKLVKSGLSPNPEADSRTLFRRAQFNLVGFPEEPRIDADFNEERIDELLDSPRFGERWARHWLDVARFAESHGFEQDYDRPHAYHYRDFVIKAFNQDMPFDQFVRWQLAGDEIAPGDPMALSATGFLGAGVFPTQLTEKEFESARYDEMDDMANTTGMAFLALTIGCARCHDHKFDPLSAKEYYRLISTFGQTIRSEIEVPASSSSHDDEQAKWEKQKKELVAILDQFEKNELADRFEEWLREPPKDSEPKPIWTILGNAEVQSLDGASFVAQADGSFLLTGKNPRNDRWVVTAKVNMPVVRAIRIEALTHKSMIRNGPGRAGNGNIALSDIRVFAKKPGREGKGKPVKLINPRADYQQNTTNLSIASSIDGDKKKTGWAVDGQIGQEHACVFEFSEEVENEAGTEFTFELDYFVNVSHVIGRPRFSLSSHLVPPIKGKSTSADLTTLLEAVSKLGVDEGLDEKQKAHLVRSYRKIDSKWLELSSKVSAHEAKKPVLKKIKMMVSTEGLKPLKHHADGRGYPHFYKETHYLDRGDTKKKGEVMEQGFLPLLMRNGRSSHYWQKKRPKGSRTSHRRNALANWITDVEDGAGHLLARVIVNRLWLHHFGQGLVPTPNDFGRQSAPPSHPELLDWLASRLIEGGWRLKSVHKIIMTSATWRQSSLYRADQAKVDLKNRWLWRFSPRRLDGEAIRDSLLAVSGMLDETMYGKGTLDQRSRRRSIYFMIKRSKLIPVMQLFDAPEPLVSQGRRLNTTIAPQALMFMNSPILREYAANFAGRLAQEADERLEKAVDLGYLQALGRLPDFDEREASLAFLAEQEHSYSEDKLANPRLLALSDFAQTLLGLNEFTYLR
ncbi:MAG: DUF1549 and DUF1553 domain-containing protein [Opitutae bacterium]